MENRNQGEKIPTPEKDGKIPASGVMSETYKEEINPQDKLGSSLNDPRDPEESNKSNEDDLDYPLEEAGISEEENLEKEREEGNSFNNNGQDNPSVTSDDEFLK